MTDKSVASANEANSITSTPLLQITDAELEGHKRIIANPEPPTSTLRAALARRKNLAEDEI